MKWASQAKLNFFSLLFLFVSFCGFFRQSVLFWKFISEYHPTDIFNDYKFQQRYRLDSLAKESSHVSEWALVL